MPFADIILPLSVGRTFTYSVTDAEAQLLEPGMRVAVPFGKSKFYTGLVKRVHDQAPELYEAKPVGQILDDRPLVTPVQLKHWQWIADYYMCSLGDVYRGAMPSAFLLESETVIRLNPDADLGELTDDQYLLYEALTQQSHLRISEAMSVTGRKNVIPVVRAMIDAGLVTLEEEINQAYKPKMVRYVRLAHGFESDEGLAGLLELLKNADKQREAVLHYFQLKTRHKSIPVKLLCEESGVAPAVVKALIQKEIFEEYQIRHDRVDFDDTATRTFDLSPAQQAALKDIASGLEKKDVALLFGVTASGKTEVYVRMIESYLAAGKQVLYLLPEIALTTQLVGRLTQHFGNQITVFHSKYTNNERVEAWRNVLEDSPKSRLIIGARSALFLPFANLGLVIVDEEHEPMFKQVDPAPRYHARDAAIVLAAMHKAKTLLGSATPAVETWYNVCQEKYALASLTQRFGQVQMPEIVVVDLKDKYFKKQMTGHFSDVMIEAIARTLEKKEQVILFQNRRGFSPVLECMTCGHVPQCKHCDVSLTYHKTRDQLRCHYCGFVMARPQRCHSCASPDLTTKGFGTEQVQLELETLFPEARVGRMDQDTTRGKHGFETILDQFRHHQTDLLVGTQMLVKGLDFENVTLAGILNADNMLHYPDFRALERSYQMMAQLAGRSGRAAKKGSVIIQTYNPYHNVIRQVVANDYQGMAAEQLAERRNYHYPPFVRMIKLTLRHRDFDKLREASAWMAGVMRQQLSIPVFGPEEPPVSRIRGEFIRNIIIKIPAGYSQPEIKKTIHKIQDSFESVAAFRPVRISINVDV